MNPTEVIPIPSDINQGLRSAKNSTMLQILGKARDSFDQECRPATRNPVKSLLVTEDVGPFRVTGVKPAVTSLREVLAQVKTNHPEVHGVLGTAGMFCARLSRGSSGAISNHAWGTAVDIRCGNILDGLGNSKHDGNTLAGLAAMAPFFNAAGWFWGVAFSSFEDGMHFEVADETVRKWHEEGRFEGHTDGRVVTATNLSSGDRGSEVRALQEALVAQGADLLPDGIFGPMTLAAVIDFQATNGLDPDGIVGPQTKAKLGLS